LLPNIAKKKRETHEKEGITVYFFSLLLRGCLLLHHAMYNLNSKHKGKKKKHNLAEKITSVVRLDF
jgi:hypothetical protein